jgi:hypothetical protein
VLVQAKASSAKLQEAQIGLYIVQEAKAEGAEEERIEGGRSVRCVAGPGMQPGMQRAFFSVQLCCKAWRGTGSLSAAC